MSLAPRIPLRNVFLLFVCAAVGLATYPDLLGALEPAISTAMVIGLMQQVVQLSRTPAEIPIRNELLFAKYYAIAWRFALAATILAYLAFNMLFFRGFIEYPDRDEVLIIEPWFYISSICIVIVILVSLVRWRSNALERAPPRKRLALLLAILTTLIMLIMVTEQTTMDFLVHRAVAGIEADQPENLQRPGVYIQPGDEGYKSLWIAIVAVMCIVASLFMVTSMRCPITGRMTSWLMFCAVVGLLIPPLAFCVWYYQHEFHRLSPDMAGAGLAISWLDWLFGGWIAVFMVTAGAYRLGKTEAVRQTVVTNLSHDADSKPLHETLPCVVILAGNGLYGLWIYWREIFDYDPLFGTSNVGRYLSMTCYPITLLMLATSLASFQLCWYRWKNRSSSISWQLVGLSPRAFCQGWVALVLILVIGIPVLRAFAFILWLGPIDLLPMFGLK